MRFLPFALAVALVPGAPAHAAPVSPFKVLKKVDGTAGRIVMTGANSGFAFFLKSYTLRPLAYRWNGRTWQSSALPPLFSTDSDVKIEAAASEPSNVWAMVSTNNLPVNKGTPAQNQVIRWTGTRWKTVAVPLPGGISRWTSDALDVHGRRITISFLQADTGMGDGPPSESRIAIWDGHRWRVEKAPARDQRLRTVLDDGRGGLWAIGVNSESVDRLYHRTAKGGWTYRPLPFGNLNTYPEDLTRLPDSRRLIGVGSTYLVHEYGRIIITR